MSQNPVSTSCQPVPRRPDGRLAPGANLNPHGRPTGSVGGRSRALQIVADIANSEQFRAALRREAEKHPFKYARAVLVPLAPAKQRQALREQIRAAEQAAFDKAQSPFFNGLKTQ